jgi:hypothetical protein
MGKISPAKKAEFAEKSKEIKGNIDELEKKIQEIQKDIKKNNDNTVSYKKILIVNFQMNIISLYLKLSTLSMDIMGIRNEAYLENARKLAYKFIAVLEEVVGSLLDVPFSETEEMLETISQVDDLKRLKLIKKISETIDRIEEKFGPDSKWKWSFPDMVAKGAVLCKNITDFKRIQKNQDPRIDGFPERNELLAFVKEYLRTAADRLREKYEMATNEAVDMKLAIRYLSSLQRICMLFSDSDASNNLKKTMKIWEEKLEQDEKQKDEKKKKETVSKKK